MTPNYFKKLKHQVAGRSTYFTGTRWDFTNSVKTEYILKFVGSADDPSFDGDHDYDEDDPPLLEYSHADGSYDGFIDIAGSRRYIYATRLL